MLILSAVYQVLPVSEICILFSIDCENIHIHIHGNSTVYILYSTENSTVYN